MAAPVAAQTPQAAPPSPPREPTLGLESAYLAGFSTGGMAILWSLPPEQSQWYEKPPLTGQGLYHRYLENISSGPVWDGDMRFFNSYGHIHSGAAYASA